QDSLQLVYAPTPPLVACVSRDRRRVRIFDSATGELTNELESPYTEEASLIRCLAWSRDSRLVATGRSPLTLWDLSTDAPRFEFKVVRANNLGFSPSGEYLVSSGWDGYYRVWDTRGGGLLATGSGSFRGFTDDGKLLLSDDNRVRISRVERSTGYQKLDSEESEAAGMRDLEFDPSGRWLITCGGHFLHWWSTESSELLASLPFSESSTTRGAKIRWVDGQGLAVLSADGVWIWPVRETKELTEVGPPTKLSKINASAGGDISRDGKLLVAVDEKSGAQRIRIRRLDDSSVKEIVLPRPPQATGFTLSPNRKLLAAGNSNGAFARLWNAETGKEIWKTRAKGNTKVAFLDDHRLALALSSRFLILDPETQKVIHEIPRAHQIFGIYTVSTPPDGSLLSITPTNRQVELLDTRNGFPHLASLDTDQLVAVTQLSPCGNFIAMGARQNDTVHLWRLGTLRHELKELGLDWDLPALPEVPGETPQYVFHLGDLAPERQAEFRYAATKKNYSAGPTVTRQVAMAIASRRTSRWEEAIRTLGQVVSNTDWRESVTQTHAQRLTHLAWWTAIAPKPHRDLEKALKFSEASLFPWPTFERRRILGVILNRLGRHREAAKSIRKGVELQERIYRKGTAWDFYPLATAYAGLAQPVAARQMYERARSDVRQRKRLAPWQIYELDQLDREASRAMGIQILPPEKIRR
ncbi:MAG: WD40 repeat domain-containing protein, partial [Planctomycetota bacterium]